MICEMEVISDSSCDSVVISGPIPDYPELKRRKTNSRTPMRNRRRKDSEDQDDITIDEKVEKIQELEDLVNATGSIPIASELRGDGDAGNWSGSDTKAGKPRSSGGKYLKKIKTLQQNKRRQETRIARLTKEVRSLRDKNSVQAAYIDVLCGMLGEDMKEKFRDRQGLGILGNVKAEDEDHIGGENGNEDGAGAWCPEEGEDGARIHRDESAMQDKEKKFYCVEELDNLPSASCSNVPQDRGVEDLPSTSMERTGIEHDGNGVSSDEEVFLINNRIENGHNHAMEDEEIDIAKPEEEEDEPSPCHLPQPTAMSPRIEGGIEGHVEEEDVKAEEEYHRAAVAHGYENVPGNEISAVEYKDMEVARKDYDAIPLTDTGCHQYDPIPQTQVHVQGFGGAPEFQNDREVPEFEVPDTQSCLFHYSMSENRPLPVKDIPETVNHHINLQDLLENGNHFLNFKGISGPENGAIPDYKEDLRNEGIGYVMTGCVEPVSSTTEGMVMKNAPYDEQQTSNDLC